MAIDLQWCVRCPLFTLYHEIVIFIAVGVSCLARCPLCEPQCTVRDILSGAEMYCVECPFYMIVKYPIGHNLLQWMYLGAQTAHFVITRYTYCSWVIKRVGCPLYRVNHLIGHTYCNGCILACSVPTLSTMLLRLPTYLTISWMIALSTLCFCTGISRRWSTMSQIAPIKISRYTLWKFKTCMILQVLSISFDLSIEIGFTE